MKKSILALLVAAAPVAGFSQVQLIAGFNFGQFIGGGYPSTNGEDGGAVGFIGSNYTNSSSPGTADSGAFHVANGIAAAYSAGTGVIYWNGAHGSDAWDFSGGSDIAVVERGGLVAINHEMVNGLQMFLGDDNNAGLNLISGANNEIALVVNTVGFADFSPASYSQNNDFNFTFSAYAVGGGASIEWLYNGSSLGVSSVATGEFQAFNVDLPAEFYGNAEATLIARVNGNLVLDNIQSNGVSAVPEPSAFAAVAGLFGLGCAALRRRRQS